MNLTVGLSGPVPLKTIITPDVVTLTAEGLLSDALLLMQENSISSIVVVDAEGFAKGIFTEQDAIRLLAQHVDITALTMREVMSCPLVKVLPNTGYSQAYQQMLEHRVRHLVVVDETDKLIGLVSEGDFLHHMGMEYLVELKTVASAMTADVMSVDGSASLDSASKLMVDNHISCLVVTVAGDAVGILTERDMVRVIRQKPDKRGLNVTAEMSEPLITVLPETPLQEAARLMEQKAIRRVVVLDAAGELKGILTRHDIARSLQGNYVEFLQETLKRQSRNLQVAENKLREVEQKVFYQELVEQVSDAIMIIDTDDGRVLDANAQAGRTLGLEHDVLLNCRVTDFLSGIDSVEQWQQDRLSVLRTVGHRIHETQFIKADGTVVPVEVNGRLVHYLEKDYVVVVARDLTDRHDAVDKLKASEKRFQALFENAPLAYQSLNLDGEIQVVNQAWLKMAGRSAEEVIGHHISEFLSKRSLETLSREFPRFVSRGQVDGPLFEFVQNDGAMRMVEVNGQIAVDPESGEMRTHCLLSDVTEKQEAEHALLESEERFRQLFMQSPIPMAVVAHDGQLISLNRTFIRTYGYEPEDVSTLETWFRKVHPEKAYRDEVRERWLGAVKTAKTEDGYIRPDGYSVLCKGGEVKQVVASGMTTEQGFLAILEDVTEQLAIANELEKSASIYEGIKSTSLDGFWVVDPQCRILDVNETYCQMSGFTREELLQKHIYDLDYLEKAENTQERISRLIELGGACFHTVHRHKNGSLFDVEVNVTYWPDLGGRFLVFLRDITLKLKNEDQLRQAAAVFSSTSEGVMITDPQGKITQVNTAFCKLTGYEESEVVGQDAAVLQSGHHDQAFYQQMWQSIREKGGWQGEVWNRRKDGSTFPELLSISEVRSEEGEVTHFVGVFADISRLKESEQQLTYLAHHDMLTDLPNRLMMQARMEQALSSAKRQGGHIALLLLDLDRFKNVNDSYGHAAGDELLKLVAETLKNRLRGVDSVCRMGGDEFAILLDNISHDEDAGKVASEIINELSHTWSLSTGVEVSIGATVGISIFPSQGDTPEVLLQQADTALYRAKHEGRGRFHYFTEEMTMEARNRLDLEARLHRAISQFELKVYYQPKVDVMEGRIIGAEALLRWHCPENGLIPPTEFIPVAEQTGLIHEIGRFVLRETCKQGAKWLARGKMPLSLAVNLSSVQVQNCGLLEEILTILSETGFPADCLELEITESALMDNEQRSSQLLSELRARGVRFAIDDFGTGYSSLAYLKKFPVDVLKIDKSFVDDIPHDEGDMTIASTIVAMGHSLGLQVVAEGVETMEQLHFLRDRQADLYQGYLCSRPVPAKAFEGLIDV